MKSLVRNLFVGLVAVALSTGTALADGHLAEGETEEEHSEDGASESSGETASDAGATSGYPQQIIARPLTLPKGAWQGQFNLNTNESFDGIGAALGFLYGVSDKLNVGANYGFTLDPSEFKGPLLIDVLFSFMTNDSMEAVATAQAGYDLLGEGLAPLSLGALVQYNLNDKMAIITPGNQLIVFLEGDVKPILLFLPVAFGYQVDDKIYAELGTNLAVIGISDADGIDGFIFADFVPVSVAGFFSPSNLIDVGVTLSTDLKNDAFDPLEIGVVARYRGGL